MTQPFRPIFENSFELSQLKDGSTTLRDLTYKCLMHSEIGCYLEAQSVYVDQSQILERFLKTNSLTLWDCGMGTTSNVIATLDHLQSHTTSPLNLFIESFENQTDGLRLCLDNLEHFKFLIPYETSLRQLLHQNRVKFTLSKQPQLRIHWSLHSGEFLDYLKTPLKKADLLYYDFYSPQDQTEEWSLTTLQALSTHLNPQARLITYVAQGEFKRHLKQVGFNVSRGQGTSMKRETTLADWPGITMIGM